MLDTQRGRNTEKQTESLKFWRERRNKNNNNEKNRIEWMTLAFVKSDKFQWDLFVSIGFITVLFYITLNSNSTLRNEKVLRN